MLAGHKRECPSLHLAPQGAQWAKWGGVWWWWRDGPGVHQWVRAVPEEYTRGAGGVSGSAGSKTLAKRASSVGSKTLARRERLAKAQEKLDSARMSRWRKMADTQSATEGSSSPTLQVEEELESKFDALRVKAFRKTLAETVEEIAVEEAKLKGLKEEEARLAQKVRIFEEKLEAE